ncbi:cytoplasmic polyadenylation element-binding protein 2 isoform X2 [Corythoichthys intestinalis]|uniref:cytoplasmic polyadenylation element-binding protein 2 isoform X2 n=1 Tax=Corythoichthys intestinalis TaxID=161448 RepID=UPI0025A64312|nr:cytoplasmic polyadenylation element-binding protein 2 isoform X2 [Corythoichthys intestinalis]
MQDDAARVTRTLTPPSIEEEPANRAREPASTEPRRRPVPDYECGFPPTRPARDLQFGPESELAARSSALEDTHAATPTSVMDSPVSQHVSDGNDNMLSGGLGAAFPEMQSTGDSDSSSHSLPGFGTPWSVQTCSSSPPPPTAPPAAGSDGGNGGGFYASSSVNPAFFQGFSANPCSGINTHGFGGHFSPQNRRSPINPQMHNQQGAFLQQRNIYNQHQPVTKASPWSAHQGNGWSTGGAPWTRDHRKGHASSPHKKNFQGGVIGPPKFPRSAASHGRKSWLEDNVFRTDGNCNTLMPLQERSRMYESLNMHSLESSLIDIMRAEQDPVKGLMGCLNPAADGLLMLNGRSSLFPIDDNLLEDGHANPGVLSSAIFPHQNGECIERFSRKVFVGGLPPDIDEDEITSSFRRFGHLVVDWPHKAESKSYFPPKGYAFLLFQEETSVQALIEACIEEDGKLYLCVSSPTIKDKPVQIRPWSLSDSDFVMDGSQPLDPRKTIFVGGVPRPLRAIELAMIMDRLYGGVCYAGIDTDPELKYPKGAGRVAFSNQQSYIAAISARFVQLQHGDIDKRVEVKPYVLDDQLCDECQGARCGGKFAPFFCANVTCLQYYCEFCWANIHSRAGREFHKPLVKEGADRPRQIHFRWN